MGEAITLRERLVHFQNTTNWEQFCDNDQRVIDLIKCFVFDEQDLEFSIAVQPNLFLAMGVLLGESESAEKASEYRLKERKATINLLCRKDPDSFGLEKITDKSVEAAIEIDSGVLEAKKNLEQAIARNTFMKCLFEGVKARTQTNITMSHLIARMAGV